MNNINEEIIEKLDSMNLDEKKKRFIKDALEFEYEIGNQSKPKFSNKYRELVNKYI